MSAAQRRQLPRWLAFISLMACTWLVWAGSVPSAVSESAPPVPDRLGLWAGKPLKVDDRTIQILETDDVSIMEYRLGAEPPVWFLQVGGFGNRAVFHPPELCFRGSHFDVLKRGPLTVIVNGRLRRVMRLVVGRNGNRFESWYWFTADRRTTPSYYQQQWWLVTAAMRRQRISGTLVRLATPMDSPAASRRRLLAFLVRFDAASHPPKAAQQASSPDAL